MHNVRTARGDMLDFDEIRVKQSLAETPTNINIQAREEFVNQRLKRRSKRMAQLITEQKLQVDSIAEQDEAQEMVGVDGSGKKTRVKRAQPDETELGDVDE